MSYKVGIIGRGFVGGAMYENFKEVFNVLVWDTDETKRNVATFDDFVNDSDIIFVCVPTPMKDDGSCDTHIVSSVIGDIARVDRRKYVVIKSTVTPGTTQQLASDLNMTIGFNPEFLTEANAHNDFRFQQLIVIGADDSGIATVMTQLCSNILQTVSWRRKLSSQMSLKIFAIRPTLITIELLKLLYWINVLVRRTGRFQDQTVSMGSVVLAFRKTLQRYYVTPKNWASLYGY
jgi:hypothetical protein